MGHNQTSSGIVGCENMVLKIRIMHKVCLGRVAGFNEAHHNSADEVTLVIRNMLSSYMIW